MAWKGDSRRHSLARKGIKTNIDQQNRFDVSNFVARGVDYQDKFSSDEKERIEYQVIQHISDVVEDGVTSGELLGDEPEFQGWFEIEIEEDENDEDIRNQHIARLIREGNTSGYYPYWSYTARVWKGD